MTTSDLIPLSYLLLDLLPVFLDVEDVPPQILGYIEENDSTNIFTHGYRRYTRVDGEVIDIMLSTLPVEGLEFAIPAIPQITFFIGIDSGSSPVSFYIVKPWGTLDYIEFRDLVIGMRLDTNFLRPVDGSPYVELSLKTSPRLYIDWQVELDKALELALSPCEIANTGIVIAFEGLQFDFSTTETLPDLEDMGMPPEFLGIYARYAHLEVLPQSVFGDTPGLSLDFYDVAIGNSGISFQIGKYYELIYSNSEIDPRSDMVGYLFHPDWQIALIAAEIELYNNAVEHFAIAGAFRIPLLDALFRVRFDLQQAVDGYQYTLAISKLNQTVIHLGHGTLSFDSFDLTGVLKQDGYAVSGSVENAVLDLGEPIYIQVGETEISLDYSEKITHFNLELYDVPLGPLGVVEQATLDYSQAENDQTSLQITAQFTWEDLRERLNLDPIANIDNFPMPPDDGEITAFLSWVEGEEGGYKLILRFTTEVTGMHTLWSFIPQPYQPKVDHFKFMFEATYETAEFQESTTEDSFSGKISVETQLKLPELPSVPGIDLIQIETGNDEGYLTANITAEIDEDGNPSFTASISDAASIDLNFPGIPQARPPVHIDIVEIGVKTSLTEQEASGEFTLNGDFALHPLLPPDEFVPAPIRPFLQNLLPADSFSGTSEISLGFADGRAAMILDCSFDQAQIDLDIFDMIYNMARGMSTPDNLAVADDIDLDIDVSFRLQGICLQMGSLSEEANAPQFSFKFLIGFRMTGMPQEVTVAFELSDQQFSLGFDRFAIPLSVPHFPIAPEDLAEFEDAHGLWQWSLWQAERQRLDEAIAPLKQNLELTTEQAETLANLQIRKFMLQSIFAIYDQLSMNEALYQTYVEIIVSAMTAVTGALHIDTTLALELRDVKFLIPFDNPQGIRIEGGAGFIGLADEDPLKPLENLSLKLGLSSEYIFFSIEGGGDPIPLPNFGIERYSGGSINLKEMRLGYGYTKNSFSFAFAGELILPANLRQDMNTSQQIGFGLLPPTHTYLAFKIDLIPIVLGPIDFVMPLFDFNLDMRRPDSQGLLDATTCTPDWDGLELIIPNIIHADVKRIAFSPMFGIFPTPNMQYDFDYNFGTDQVGYTIVVDNMLILMPYLGYYPLPYIADGMSPFMDNLCVDVRLAGFGIHFNIQRPFPSLSPLILFELLGLLSDPLMPIDPNGHLASTIRFAIQNGSIQVPTFVLRLFPELDAVVNRDFNVSINLGTFITVAQQILHTLKVLITTVTSTTQKLADQISTIVDSPPDIELSTLLSALPPELRKLRTGGALAGFEASAILLLITPQDAQAEFAARDMEEEPNNNEGGDNEIDKETHFDKLLFQDSFSTFLKGWHIIDEGRPREKSNWFVKRGNLWQTSTISGTNLVLNKHYPQTMQLIVTMRNGSKDGSLGLVFRFQDRNNCYRFVMGGMPHTQKLIKIQDGQSTLLHEPGRLATQPVTGLYQVIVQTIKNHIAIVINGELWYEGIDEDRPIEKGSIGLYSFANSKAEFGEVRLYVPSNGHAIPRLPFWQSTIVSQKTPSHPFQTAALLPQPRLRSPQNITYTVSDTDHPLNQLPEPNALYQTSKPNLELAKGQRFHDPDDPQNNLFQGIEFKAFTADDLSAIPQPDGNLSGIIIGAHVKVFTGQRFRFLGYLFDNGVFGLVTALEINPLKLTVLGIDVELPLEIDGRLQLQGRAKRDGVIGSISAQGYAIWKILPLNVLTLYVGGGSHTFSQGDSLSSIAQRFGLSVPELRAFNQITGELRIGQELSFPPARLKLYSDGRFALKGSVQLSFFNGAASLGGWVDVSHSHCYAGGWFAFRAGPLDQPPVINLGLACEGRIGPGPHFLLRGAGKLEIMGHALAHVSGEISESHAMITANLDTNNWLDLIDSRLFLKLYGRIDIAKPFNPAFDLAGEGYIKVGRARVDGAGGIKRTQSGAITTFMAGSLKWGRNKWLDGRVQIGTDGAEINGRASFALDLTPSQLPGNIKVASLFLKVDIEGDFTFSTQTGFASASLDVNWLLGVRLPGTNQQTLPLAMQQLDFDLSLNTLNKKLIDVNGFKLLPFDKIGDVKIPYPIITADDDGPHIHFRKGLPPLSLESRGTGEYLGNLALKYEVNWASIDFPLNSSFKVYVVWHDQRPRIKIQTGTGTNRKVKYFL